MKDFRYRAQGLGDLLNYALMIDEGVMLLKDGAFCAGWSYQGPDMFTCEDTTKNLLRGNLHQIFSQLGNGWMIHADLIRSATQHYIDKKSNHFPNTTSLYIDEERRHFFEQDRTHFSSQYYLVLTYKPPNEVETKYQRFFLAGSDAQLNWATILDTFKARLEQIENSLSKNLVVKKLTTDDLLTHIHHCITGKSHRIILNHLHLQLDHFVATQDFLGGFAPRIGEKHIALLGINAFPSTTTPNLLQHLSELPVTFRYSNRFIFLDQTTSNQFIKKSRRYWFQKKQGVTGLIREACNMQGSLFYDQDAIEMAHDSDSALHESEGSLTGYGFYTGNVVIMEEEPDALNNAVKILTKAVEKKGFAVRCETINAVEAYLGSLPGHGFENIRKPMISIINFADLLPLLCTAQGKDTHPSPLYPKQSPLLFYAQTQGRTPYRVCLHESDVGHTLVVGDTGSGKSTLLGFLMAQHLRYPDAQIFMFDKGYSSFTLCHALMGQHYDIAGDQSISFAPLQHIHRLTELDWACEWLEIVYRSQGLSLTPLQRKEIRHSLERLSCQSQRTLTALQATLQDQTLKAALEFYTLSGAMGQLLDAQDDSLASSPIQIFEMQHLLNKEEKFAIPVLDYLFHQINKRLDPSKPTLIIIEEGHRFLKGHFGDQLEVWLRETRKQNAAVVFVTQGLSEIMQSDCKHILLNSCPTKLFLPNPNASAGYNRDLYSQVGLSHSQIDLIANSIPKQDYYLVSPSGNQLMDLALSKGFLALMENTNPEKRQTILDLRNQYQDQWAYHFLLEKGFKDQAQIWMNLHNH